MDDRLLGGFEQLVLLAVLRLGDDAFALTVRELLERRLGRSVSRGAVYTALQRLDQRGLVTTEWGEPRPERGGRARRNYSVSPRGVELLRESRELLVESWHGLDVLQGSAR